MHVQAFFKPYGLISVLGISSICLTGCTPPDVECFRTQTINTPITISKDEFRQQVTFVTSKRILENGKILTYKQYLFVSEPNQGIHVFNNEDPENPEAIGFITVPENKDFFVKDDVLFVQSHADLVQVDISDSDNIREVARSHDVFTPPNLYRYGWFNTNSYPIDRNTTVVIGVDSQLKAVESSDVCYSSSSEARS